MTDLVNLARWPSLTDQLSLAERLFGKDGRTIVSDWFTGEIGRIDDPAFAKLFTYHINLPGVRGLKGANEEFLLAATAQNLKRMAKMVPS